MKIRRISIERYRSLREVPMEDVGDLVVLIGANSSGKTNLLEALTIFFDELDPALERNLGGIDDYVWFNRDSNHPIVFSIDIESERDEMKDLALDELTYKVRDKNEVSIVRAIEGTRSSAVWRTKTVALNKVPLVENGALAPPADSTGNTLRLLFERLKGKMVYISAARSVTTDRPRLGSRTSFINPSALAELTSMGQGREVHQDRRWIQLEDSVTRCSQSIESISVVAGEVMVREKGRASRVRLSLTGGGHQELMYLLYRIQQTEGAFYAIEEPEAHLHPGLVRQLLGALERVTQEKQVFLSTQSTLFVDQADLNNVWVVRAGEQGTEVLRVHEPRGLTSILLELGSRPSDIFFADAIIFTEGPTEEKVIPIWAAKMGIDLSKLGVKVRPTYGKDSGKYHLRVLIDATENVQVRVFMVLDKDAEAQTRNLVKTKALVLNKNLFLLTKGSIEEYYPKDKFVDALKSVLRSEYNIELTQEEVEAICEGPRSDRVGKMLADKLKLRKPPNAWKPMVGEIVAQSMSRDEIDEDIQEILERIFTGLRLR